MAKIHILDNGLINKIAAGEVVERPASVVKELVENSIDAGADRVVIEIQNGGISLIKITDNGRGIPADEAETAFMRHATSKLEKFEDLGNIMTLGFRGEALSSIASVAKVEMQTMTETDANGTRLVLEGGRIVDKQPCAATKGTVFTVRDLFFNTPARRKFLKKPAAESGHVSDIIYRIALGHPELAIKFVNNGSTVFQTNGSGDLKTTVLYTYGSDMVQSLIPVCEKRDGYTLSGLIGKPELNRGNRSYQNFFINGRYIKSRLVSQAAEDAYKGRIMIGKFPVFMLDLRVPPDTVDVNVHPTKLEARFSNENFIYDLIYNTIFNALKKEVLIPKAEWDDPGTKRFEPLKPENTALEEKDEPTVPQRLVDTDVLTFKESVPKEMRADLGRRLDAVVDRIMSTPSAVAAINGQDKKIAETRPQPVELPKTSGEQQDFLDKIDDQKHFFNNYKIVGQLFNTYWVIEQGSSMYMIDQHAAHERVLYEELTNRLADGEKPASQLLLQPLALSITPAEANIIEENRDLLEGFGFELESLGLNAYALRAVPHILKEPASAAFFMEIVDTLQKQPVSTPYQTRLDAVATISCKAAVKGNDRLGYSEAKELIERMLRLENPFSCPHGRPTVIEMTKYELEKKFKRIQ